MDGGICSQMHFYLVGTILQGMGSKITYDLSWYETEGTDLDGKHARNFDLLKLFPSLDFKQERNQIIKRLYITSFFRHNEYFSDTTDACAWMNYHSPLYLTGYFRDRADMYGKIFRSTFSDIRPEPDEKNSALKTEMRQHEKEGEETCAVHIRRGDLSRYNAAYGNPVSPRYFQEAMQYIKAQRQKRIKFYIFSDEPSWCYDNILKETEGTDYKVIDFNGSDKGYLDLYLISECRHIICSQGTMGKYGALLREESKQEGIVVLPPNKNSEFWVSVFKNSIQLTDL
ncbi:MAG: alpha-1,2-fucosyltransferase [Bacteroides sp.]|nr:alpha-1,2-fucosyltransferase [Bacteroidales bacterium]MBD5305414.1 alpha-1,2-fucosyltransferase [Bacteroides sp.]